ncbi:sugar ABC transporter substrate-binding protein [Amaricoccus sp.]|uniref:sugar ABC transporter substrate-binding protein n=1 Tax=Amaricoccus sp. TaxID=1872485 RepID=UPI001B768738|nr:sugar ABC transporter substrate-binding protein [Amaricoccus sp.]MBP7001870.1 sugar ABC transporter substrate-binding protein [Amaricoccus sp.]
MTDKIVRDDAALQEIGEVGASRRDALRLFGAGSVAGALLASAGFSPALAQELNAASKPLKAAFSNAGLQATWCAQGKQAAEAWGKLMNVEITWFDGELAATKQRAAIDNMASQPWDFVAIQSFGIGTLTDPVNRMIEAGIPVVAMDTLIAPPGTIDITTFIAPDNVMMGAVATEALMKSIGGKGNVVMTQGALGHSGAQGRAKGFQQVVANYPDVKVLNEEPADWDVTKVARIWDSVLTQNPEIAGAFFHNDDMALAAFNVIKSKQREGIKLAGVDAMPPAVNAVIDGVMVTTVRNPSCRIHGWSVAAGVAAVAAGGKAQAGIPVSILADGPVVTAETAEGQLWLQKQFLM